MKKFHKSGIILLFAVCISVVSFNMIPCHAQDAASQLEDATNTGTLFDGSDGNRFGTDTGITSSGSVPDASPPAAVDTSSTTASGTDIDEPASSDDSGSESDQDAGDDSDDSGETDTTGTEPAE